MEEKEKVLKVVREIQDLAEEAVGKSSLLVFHKEQIKDEKERKIREQLFDATKKFYKSIGNIEKKICLDQGYVYKLEDENNKLKRELAEMKETNKKTKIEEKL